MKINFCAAILPAARVDIIAWIANWIANTPTARIVSMVGSLTMTGPSLANGGQQGLESIVMIWAEMEDHIFQKIFGMEYAGTPGQQREIAGKIFTLATNGEKG